MSKSDSRLQKYKQWENKYPRDFPGRETVKSVLNCHCHFWKDNLQDTIDKNFTDPNRIFKIAGRISARRNMGNNIFFDLFDHTGSIQLHAKKLIDVNEIARKRVHENDLVWVQAQECDLGDCIGVEGTIGANPRGEILFQIQNWTLLAKALREPPDKFHGISKPESRYRHRELDLLSSADSREVFKKRAEIVFEIRKYLNDRNYFEIETPVLQPIYGGATAKPFITHHNTLSQNFFLSISSELYLKRALVGGFDRVYSFSRCFRNEGISPTHNPEFTNLEIFESCKTADDMAILTQDLISHLCVFTNFKGLENLISKWGTRANDLEFKTGLPSADWPLSRRYEGVCGSASNGEKTCHDKSCFWCSENNRAADAWELFINDMEIASGASDLNDPFEQKKRLLESEFNSLESNNNIDYDPFDANYIEALEQGALPWAGVGIGVDRLCMLLLDKNNIRDVIMFNTLKNE